MEELISWRFLQTNTSPDEPISAWQPVWWACAFSQPTLDLMDLTRER
jgi:hypothetical protein